MCNKRLNVYICEFGRAGNGGGAPDRAGIFGNSLGAVLFGLVAFCRFGNGGGIPTATGACGCGLLDDGGDGAFLLGLDVFDLFGFTSKS